MCNPLDPGGCLGDIGRSAAEEFFKMIADGARDVLKAVSTFWMEVPSPNVAYGSGNNWVGAESITSVQSWLSPLALVIFMITVGAALLKVAYDTRRAGEGMAAIVRALVTTLAAGVPLLAMTMVGIQFGDQFAPWVLEKASAEETSDGFADLLITAMMGSEDGLPAASGALLLIYLVAILGGIMQCVFMVIRGAAIIILLCFAQVTAAGTATEEGWLRFKRIGMLLLAFVLYKPVAAVIYGVGLKLMSSGTTGDDQVMNAIYGLTVMLMAALSLFAVMKFVAPVATMGASGAFSGGAAVGAVATGAAMVALAGTGGGAAAAGGAAGRGGGGAGGGTGPKSSEGPGAKDVSPASSDDSKDAGSPPTPPSDDSNDSGSGNGPGTGPGNGPSEGPSGGDAGNGSGGDGPGGDGSGGSGPHGGSGGAQASPVGGSGGGESDSPEGQSDGTGAGAETVDPGQSGSGGSGTGDGSSRGPRSGGGSALQAGAQTVQNIGNQINQAGDDASRE